MEFSQDEYASLQRSVAHGYASHRSLPAPLAAQERSRIAIADQLLCVRWPFPLVSAHP